MQSKETKYWFPAKRYGWGWGLPITWQGWVVLVVWMVLQVSGLVLLPKQLCYLIPYMVVLLAAIVAICWAKGERLRWRWGK